MVVEAGKAKRQGVDGTMVDRLALTMEVCVLCRCLPVVQISPSCRLVIAVYIIQENSERNGV